MLSGLTNRQAAAILYDWTFWARPEQLAPEGEWFIWLLRSGRGFGKTRTGAEFVRQRVREGYRRIALVGQTKGDVRDTMIEVGESALLNVCPPWDRPVYEPSKRRVTWPNGAMAIAYSGDEPDQLRGPQHDTAWVDELAKLKYPDDTWSNLLFGLRLGRRPQICVTTTPRPIPLVKNLVQHPRCIDVRRSTRDNLANLSPIYIREVIEPLIGTRLGRQEIEGEIIDDAPGALWKRAQIDTLRVAKAPQLSRIVTAIDPAVTSSARSDETGIIVAGLGRDGHGYVLEDLSLRASPHGWATQAVAGHYRWQGDRVVGEMNNGGEMVEATLRTVDANLPYRGVHASRSKQARAEPIAALYEQGKVHHVGHFADLEDQLCTWEPNTGDASPDRLDALVWALTELMLLGGEPADLSVSTIELW